MWFERVKVEGFGQFSDFELRGFGPGLVVVHGPNEAGKSTLRQFVRWMLFDLQARQRSRWMGPGGQLAGTLAVRLADGSATLVREGKSVELRRRHAVHTGSSALGLLLRGMDAALFDAVFTFDLFDLQQIGALRDEHVQNLLAVGATLGAGRHPADIVKGFDDQASVYLKVRSRAVEIPQAEAEIERLRGLLRAAREGAERYDEVVTEVAANAARIAGLRERQSELVAQRRELERLQEMWPGWNVWQALCEEVHELQGDRPRIPKETRERLRVALDESRSALEASRLADERLEAAVTARDSVVVDEAVLARGSVVDDLVAKLVHVEARSNELNDLRQREVEGRIRLESELDALGDGWDADRLGTTRLDASIEAEARRLVSETAPLSAQVTNELTKAEGEVQRVDGELAELDGRLAALPPEAALEHVAAAEAMLAEASARVADSVALADALARIDEVDASRPMEPPAGWPDVCPQDLTAVEQHAAAWRDAVMAHEAHVRAASDRVVDAERAVAVAEAELEAARAMPGAGEPTAEVVSALEARWPAVRDEIVRDREIADEIARRGEAITKLPARVGGGVDVAALERVDIAAESRARLERAYEAAAAAAQGRREARAAAATVADSPGMRFDPADRAVAEGRRDALVQARAALDDLQATRGGSRVAPPPLHLPLVAVAILTVLVVVGALFAQLVLAGLALVGAVGLAIAVVLQRRAERSNPVPDAGTAEVRFGQLAKAAGFGASPSRGEIEVALEAVKETLLKLDRDEERAIAAADQERRAVEAREALADAERTHGERARELARVLVTMRLPVDADRSVALAWLDAATELRAVSEKVAELRHEQQGIRGRIRELRVALEGLVGRPLAGADAIEPALRALRTRRDQADARDEALRSAQAGVDQAGRALDETRARMIRIESEAAVPSDVRAEWDAWVRVRELPAGEPDTWYVEQTRTALAAASWRKERGLALQQVTRLSSKVEPFRERLAAVVSAVGLTGGNADQDLGATVERLRAVVNTWHEASAERGQLRAARSKVSAERKRVAGALDMARKRAEALETQLAGFETWRKAASAPETLTPADAVMWVERVRSAQGAAASLATVNDSAKRRESEIAAFVARVVDLGHELSLSVRDDLAAAGVWLRDRKVVLDGARGALTRRQERENRVGEADNARGLARRTADRLAQEWRTAAAEVGCGDEASWEARLDVEERLDVLIAERRTVEAELRGALGGAWADEARWARWSGVRGEGFGEHLGALEEESVELEAELDQTEESKAKLQAQASRLETATDVIELEMQLEAAQVRLEAAKREWWRLRIARHLLQETFERFRKERQPAVIRRASEWFRKASEEAYVGLDVDEEGSGIRIMVRGQDGAAHAAEQLSTGTTALVYLCLRLALAVDQAGHTAAVPILLDDVLAHFDPERAAAAARLFVEVAASAPELQLVLFTCRPETVASLRASAPAVRVLELARWAGADSPVARPISHSTSSISSASAVRSETPRSAVPADERLAELLEDAVQLLRERGEPLAKSDFGDGLGIEDPEWTALRGLLEVDDRVESNGKHGRGRRYTVATS